MFKNQSLQVRLIGAFLFIGLIVLIVALVGWSGNSRLSGHLKTLSGNTLPSIENLWKVNDAKSRVYGADKAVIANALTKDQRQKELTNIQVGDNDITDGLNAYEKLLRDSDEDKIYKKVLPVLEKFRSANQEYLQIHDKFMRYNIPNPRKVQVELLSQGKSNTPEFVNATAATQVLSELYDYSVEKLTPAFESLANTLQELLAYNQEIIKNSVKTADQDVSKSTFWTLVGVIIGPLTAVIFGISIAQPMGAKIAGVAGVAQKISTGDLTTQVPATNAQDEIGQLQNAFRTMTQNLNSLISQVQQSGIQITTSATQIAASGKQLEATMTEQAASTNQVAATAKQIAVTSGQLVKTMEQVEHSSQTTAASAGESQQDLMHMETTMRKLAEATGSISAKLGVINEKASNINSIVTTITKVADQTNLLSLNAAIEAEKAGEYGTGFAVVAREIRRLADQTAVATLDIENMVKEMQSAVSTGVMEMNKFTKEVEHGVEGVASIGRKLELIIEQVQALTPRFQQVSESVEGQSQGATQISEAMGQLSEASSQTAASLREVNGAIQQLNEAAHGLRQEISRFQIA